MQNNKIGHIAILNEYLANLKVLNNNLYNFHFNVIGKGFFQIHKKLEDYYKLIANMYDEVAERIKMLGDYPITSLIQYEETSTLKSRKSIDYPTKQVFEILINDFSFMLGFSNELKEYATTIKDTITEDLMTKYIVFFEKEIWMLEASNI